MHKFKLRKKDVMTGDPSDCETCAFALRLKDLLGKEKLDVFLARKSGLDFKGLLVCTDALHRGSVIKSEEAADFVAAFDNIYCLPLNKREEARLALYEKYKNKLWKLENYVRTYND